MRPKIPQAAGAGELGAILSLSAKDPQERRLISHFLPEYTPPHNRWRYSNDRVYNYITE